MKIKVTRPEGRVEVVDDSEIRRLFELAANAGTLPEEEQESFWARLDLGGASLAGIEYEVVEDEVALARKITLFVRGDAFVLGRHWEDGSERVEERYYVVAEDEQGHRWAHKSRFAMAHSCDLSGCDEGEDDSSIVDFRCESWDGQPYKSSEAAQKAALDFAARIRDAQAAGKWRGPWSNAHWEPIDPAYGAESWRPEEEQEREQA